MILLILSGALLLIVVPLTVFILREAHHQRDSEVHHQHYSYEDISSVPQKTSPGKWVGVIWQPVLDARAGTGPISTLVMLSVLLVPQADFQKGVCGSYPRAVVLNTIQADDLSAKPYQLSVRIPAIAAAGDYELVAQVTKGPASTCQGWTLVVTAS